MDLRAAALNAEDITIEQVTVPEWGGAVFGVKGLTLGEQRRFIAAVTDPDGSVNRERYAPQLLIRAVVDPDTNTPVFEAADAQALEAKSAAAVQRLLTVASKLAGLGVDEDEVIGSLDVTPADASDSG